MKTLKTLVKLHKQKLDGLRRHLVSLESQVGQLQALDKNLEQELATEIALAETSNELAAFFGDYIRRIRLRQARIRQEVIELEKQISKARDAIRVEYAEQLKYEKILERKIAEEKATANRKENIELNDIAGRQHMQKEEV